MNLFQVILAALQAVSQIAVNPALGLHADGVRLAGLVGFIGSLAQEGASAIPELEALTAQIKALDAAGGPIPEEVLQSWEARHAAAKARLAALKDPG